MTIARMNSGGMEDCDEADRMAFLRDAVSWRVLDGPQAFEAQEALIWGRAADQALEKGSQLARGGQPAEWEPLPVKIL